MWRAFLSVSSAAVVEPCGNRGFVSNVFHFCEVAGKDALFTVRNGGPDGFGDSNLAFCFVIGLLFLVRTRSTDGALASVLAHAFLDGEHTSLGTSRESDRFAVVWNPVQFRAAGAAMDLV